MWAVMAQSHPWTNVTSMDGAFTTVGIVKMQEWCAEVELCMYREYVCIICVCSCTFLPMIYDSDLNTRFPIIGVKQCALPLHGCVSTT